MINKLKMANDKNILTILLIIAPVICLRAQVKNDSIKYSCQANTIIDLGDTSIYHMELITTIFNNFKDTIYIPYQASKYAFLNQDSTVLLIDMINNVKKGSFNQVLYSRGGLDGFITRYGFHNYCFNNYGPQPKYNYFAIPPDTSKKVKTIRDIGFTSRKIRNKTFRLYDFLIRGTDILIINKKVPDSIFYVRNWPNIKEPVYLTIALKVEKKKITYLYKGFDYYRFAPDLFGEKRRRKYARTEKKYERKDNRYEKRYERYVKRSKKREEK